MGRKSKAQTIIDAQEDGVAENPDSRYLIMYDFKAGLNPRQFYVNLHRLFDHYGGFLVQRSVVEIVGYEASKAVESLARGYGAKVLRYRVLKEE